MRTAIVEPAAHGPRAGDMRVRVEEDGHVAALLLIGWSVRKSLLRLVRGGALIECTHARGWHIQYADGRTY